MATKSLILGLLTVFLVFSFTSAADLVFTNTSATSVTASPSTDVSFNFILNNTNSAGVNYSISWSNSTGVGSWKQIPVLSLINAGSTQALSAVLNIPSHTPQGTYQASLTATNTTAQQATIPFTITVPPVSTLTITKTKELTKTQNGSINVTNTGNVPYTNVDLSASGAFPVTFSQDNFALSVGESKSVNVNADPTVFASLKFGNNVITISASANSATPQSISFSIPQTFCKNGPKGTDLSLNSIDVNNDGEDDEIWKPLDTVTVKVRIDNDGTNDASSVYVELGLFDVNGKNAVNDLDFVNSDEEKIKLGTIKDGEDDTATFEFKVPYDIKEGAYSLAIKAYSRNDGENNSCIDSSTDLDNKIFHSISVEKENDEGKIIAFDRIVVTPSEAVCGDKVILSTDVINIGSDNEDRVRVNLYSKELNLDLDNEITRGIDSEDKESTSFSFTVPQGLADKSYRLELTAEYDYRNGVYRESSENPEYALLKVFGCTVQSTTTTARIATISASLESDAKAGKEVVIKGTITNVANATTAYIVNAKGYDSWASLTSISDRVITLNVGESKDVTFKFNANKDASGENSFIIEVMSNGKSETREVAVEIASSTNSLSSLFKNNALAWVIGLVNLILIVLIIVVAVRLSRR